LGAVVKHPALSVVAPLLTMVTAGGGVLPPRGILAAVSRTVTVTVAGLLGCLWWHVVGHRRCFDGNEWVLIVSSHLRR